MTKKEKRNFFDLLTEIIGWISIAISPLLIGSIIGLVIYSFKSDKTGFVFAILVSGLGLITGVIWATGVWKNEGTIRFLSRLLSSGPVQDNEETNQ